MRVSKTKREAMRVCRRIESELVSLRQIYDTLSNERKKLLEAVLKKIVVCNHLLSELLPSASLDEFILDFDSYLETATRDIKENRQVWPSHLIHLFAGCSGLCIRLHLPHAYLAVKSWNLGKLYAPDHLALYRKDPNYPVTRDDLKGGLNEKAERLTLKSNEPLGVLGDLEPRFVAPDEDGPPPALANSCDSDP